jgi:hypothetical protein
MAKNIQRALRKFHLPPAENYFYECASKAFSHRENALEAHL